MTKLYELPRGSWFRIAANPEYGPFKLDHIDGMYSLCWLNGEIAHINCGTEVIQIEEPKEDNESAV